ncbi:MAG TPA: MFS transporter [Bryobacteraceae bacterium]|nr:MFS transporter [Bryobacteraceae bacterium]HOL72995.1 MFS transporter [Bryobacteraceae bacterium]HOQ43947.1 MFS transporter [Bryobacteraceae bacterium]HPQ14764.1 MFS transporter [Bryobacteraceae bacterium]HPU72925.1 MFS transporter [Bryobacteraceae bacterium]
MTHSGVSLPAYWRLVKSNRNFRYLWLAQIVSEMGDWIYTIAIYSLLFEVTNSARAVALAVVLQVLPQCFAAPIAGVVNDRLSRRTVMIAADLARAVIVLGMLFVSRAQIIWLIYVLLLLETMMWAFFEPGRSASIPNIVGRENLVVANGLSSMTWSLNLAIGSGLGGAVAALFGRDAVFILNCCSFLLSALLVAQMRYHEPHLAGAAPLRARDLVDFSPMIEGIRYVRRNKPVLALLLVKTGLGLLGTHLVLLPVFGERIFPVQMEDMRRGAMLGMSALMSSRGVGALLGPIIGNYWAGQRHKLMRLGILIGYLVCGAGYAALAAAPTLAFAALAVMFAHGGISIVWVFSTTLLQLQTQDSYRGRVFSADFALLVVAMSIANYSTGLATDWGVPARLIAAATGVFSLVPAVVWMFGMRIWKDADS